MKRRKPNNMKARMDRTMRGLLRQHRACIVDASGPEIQVMLHYNSGRQILSKQVADALCDIAHHWTVNIGALCVDQVGERYIKRVEFETAGIYLAKHLGGEIEAQYRELVFSCNQNHLVGTAWIAIPDRVALDDGQVERIYESVGAWEQSVSPHEAA